MKAIRLHRRGGPDELVLEDAPVPGTDLTITTDLAAELILIDVPLNFSAVGVRTRGG